MGRVIVGNHSLNVLTNTLFERNYGNGALHILFAVAVASIFDIIKHFENKN